ncbi:MAG: hypothetical protein ACRDTK_00555 [Mycobacterium sp.]
MTAAFNEQAFFEAWRRGVTIAGCRWFGDGQTSPDTAKSKWDLAPRVDDISASIGVLSSGEAMLLAAMVSFYNSEPGGQMLRDLGATGLSDISAGLDEQRRSVVADLLVSYPGW